MFKFYKVICMIGLFTVCSFAQWSLVPTAPAVYIRSIINSDNVLYLSTAGSGVYTSTDQGDSWQPINNGLISLQSKDVFEVLDWNGALYAATTDGIYKFTDSGDSWVKKSNGITIGPGALYEFTESIFEYNSTLFTGAWNGLYRSQDGGENWSLTNVSGEGVLAKNFTAHNGILFAARESINTPYGYKSTDNGITWQDLTEINFPSITFFSEPSLLWMGSIDGVWLSTDDGLTWENRNNGLNLDPYSSCIIRVDGVLVTSLKFGGSDMFRSFNNGLDWEHFNEGLPFLNSIEKLISYNGKILAATSGGLYQRDNSQIPVELISFTASVFDHDVDLRWVTATEKNNRGFEVERGIRSTDSDVVNWKDIGYVPGAGTTTNPASYIFSDENVPPGIYNYRLQQNDLNGSFNYSPVVKVTVERPAEFKLNQNYPNPFNPSTNLSFVIGHSSSVTLKVYDVPGNLVEILVNEARPAGNYTVNFNAEGLSSGIYYYTLKAGNFVSTRKMILIK